MRWIALRKWIGREPAWRVNQATFISLGACILVGIVLGILGDFMPFMWRWDGILLVLGVPSLLFLAGAVAAAWAGLICGRAGIPLRRVLPCVAWDFVYSGLYVGFVALVPIVAMLLAERERLRDFAWWAIPAAWLGLSVLMALSHLAGCAVALVVTRWMIRTGRWEVTVPVEMAKTEGAP